MREDTYRHKGLRENLIQDLRQQGITDESVLKAMLDVPRHFFLDAEFDTIAYENRAFPIAADQTISSPYTVAFQSQLLQVRPYDKILEIGTGSMYQSTILAAMDAVVISIERQKVLYDKTSNYMLKTKYPPSKLKFIFGDGFTGQAAFSPFDKIIITCGAPFIPPALVDQLKPGGIMVIPLAEDEHHKMIRITKQEDGTLIQESFADFSFVPMLPGRNTENN